MKDRLYIFDTTLRDGEQAPGATMTKDEKLRVAKMLEKMRVDVIEAGFPASSPGDFDAVRSVSEIVKNSRVCGLCRAHEKDIRIAAEALSAAAGPRIHIFLATSPIHMAKKLQKTPDQVFEMAVEAVKLGRSLCDDIEFSAEDAGRSDIDFLCRVFEAVINAGATTINVPDTVGYNMPTQFGHLIKELIARVPNSDKAIWSVHCHDDLGLATANSLAAVEAGARQVECTINGLGERAGNAALEEIVMAVRTRQDIFACDTRIDATQIAPTSRLVSAITGFVVQPNKAIVGANAFVHASGVHQDGVLKDPSTYEIIKAEDVGWSVNRLVLGKLSGRNALKAKLQELDIDLSEAELEEVFIRFKELADKKREIYDDDLRALVTEGTHNPAADPFRLTQFEVHSKTGKKPHAIVSLVDDKGIEHRGESEGSGPVDAILKAVDSVVKTGAELELFAVSNITSGTESQGEVTIRLRLDGRTVNGVGADTDIVVASAKAYLNAWARLKAR
jgi:2-isopropylmalate synthase